ncbi:LPXTG cell wall anchor domain-containing protein [Enterococcus sp. DIV0170]|uniref:LPXTG cell wall anchor domain-containing protein n=1 Tax=Enterococcus sp. DIV0170 TaxID=2774642 RepID=UPI003F296576
MKKIIFLLCLIIVSSFPISAQGAEAYFPVGIGFAKESVKREADPPINVPTETRYIASGNTFRSRRLPQTGDSHTHGVQFLGLLCLCSCFWGFLVTQLREEEENE